MLIEKFVKIVNRTVAPAIILHMKVTEEIKNKLNLHAPLNTSSNSLRRTSGA